MAPSIQFNFSVESPNLVNANHAETSLEKAAAWYQAIVASGCALYGGQMKGRKCPPGSFTVQMQVTPGPQIGKWVYDPVKQQWVYDTPAVPTQAELDAAEKAFDEAVGLTRVGL